LTRKAFRGGSPLWRKMEIVIATQQAQTSPADSIVPVMDDTWRKFMLLIRPCPLVDGILIIFDRVVSGFAYIYITIPIISVELIAVEVWKLDNVLMSHLCSPLNPKTVMTIESGVCRNGNC